MLINLSNHPSAQWQEAQKEAAMRDYGYIKDLSFPEVKPEASLEEVETLAKKYVVDCLACFDENRKYAQKNDKPDAVHVMGEMTFTYQFVHQMSREGVLCVASTTRRNTKDLPDGEKLFKFNFVGFRPYTADLF